MPNQKGTFNLEEGIKTLIKKANDKVEEDPKNIAPIVQAMYDGLILIARGVDNIKTPKT